MNRFTLIGLVAACGLAACAPVGAQNAAPPPAAGRAAAAAPEDAGGPPGRGRGPRIPAYPPRITDPQMVERGRVLFTDNNCASCHAADIRGSETGPSLLRSQLVQRDQKGELIAPIIRNGSVGMPASAGLTDTQIADIAEFLHSFPINSRDPARERPETIVTGDAALGQSYFAANCTSCHSVTGDLKGIGGKFDDPRALQTRMLSPQTDKPTTVAVTQADGTKIEGRLGNIDEFMVSLTLPDGTQRTFRRNGDTPKVEVHDPLEAHQVFLSKYTDDAIHNLTAYLVTLK